MPSKRILNHGVSKLGMGIIQMKPCSHAHCYDPSKEEQAFYSLHHFRNCNFLVLLRVRKVLEICKIYFHSIPVYYTR
uniref:Uncharacterized protein n=1 Tax=Wuchereria bancrofti TaxID=6293 RepID=A0AAF5PHU7_WUCBA